MIRKGLILLATMWLIGFGAFMLLLARPLEGETTDAIVVPTGGAGRIDRGLALLQDKQARRLLITGVAPQVQSRELAAAYNTSHDLFACCVDLGHEAVDTQSNAQETADWVRDHGYRSVRLVTSDWHVARAKLELIHALGQKVRVVGDGVPSHPRLILLIAEYNKLLLRQIALWVGIGR